jgi:trans-2,3-dihydro-3-hydroxyanthranilate isomerase
VFSTEPKNAIGSLFDVKFKTFIHMSMQTKFYITDVFGNSKYSGNQLATFIIAEHISSQEMQQIAAEINFPETTFILNSEAKNGGYDVRIFTPKSEVDFAGHPTLGTAWLIHKYILNGKGEKVSLNLKVGQIPVTIVKDLLWMKQVEPKFMQTHSSELLANTLSINISDIDTNFPIQEVSTGLPFTLVPLKSKKALAKARIDIMHYESFCQQSNAKGILVFAPEGHTPDQQLSVRVFVNYLGIPEDPATGSANGCLAGYFVNYNYFNTAKIDIKIGQGYEMSRPSEIHLKAELSEETIEIRVGGKVFEVAEGFWFTH